MFPRAEIVIHADDIAFWSDPGLRDGHIPAATRYLDSAAAMLGAYRDQLRPSRASTVAPGLTLLELPGHTPGHASYRFDSAGETLLIWGDTVHVPEIQIPRPQVTSEYDIDEPLAAESRRRIFDLVATERLLVAGGHLHMPGCASRAKRRLLSVGSRTLVRGGLTLKHASVAAEHRRPMKRSTERRHAHMLALRLFQVKINLPASSPARPPDAMPRSCCAHRQRQCRRGRRPCRDRRKFGSLGGRP